MDRVTSLRSNKNAIQSRLPWRWLSLGTIAMYSISFLLATPAPVDAGIYDLMDTETAAKRACVDAGVARDDKTLTQIEGELTAKLAALQKRIPALTEAKSQWAVQVASEAGKLLEQATLSYTGMTTHEINRLRARRDELHEEIEQQLSETSLPNAALLKDYKSTSELVASINGLTQRLEAMSPEEIIAGTARAFPGREANLKRFNTLLVMTTKELEQAESEYNAAKDAVVRAKKCIADNRAKPKEQTESTPAAKDEWTAHGEFVCYCSYGNRSKDDWAPLLFNDRSLRLPMNITGKGTSVTFQVTGHTGCSPNFRATGRVTASNRVTARANLRGIVVVFSGTLYPHPAKPGIRVGNGSWQLLGKEKCENGEWETQTN